MASFLQVFLACLFCKRVETYSQKLYQPYGPKMCEALCQNHEEFTAWNFDEEHLVCKLGVKTSEGLGHGINRLQPGSTKTGKTNKSFHAEKTGHKKRVICPAAKVELLHSACRSGKFVMVKRLLSRGEVDVNCRGEEGRTAVMEAALFMMGTSFDLLVKHKCDLSAVDEHGDTVLHFACDGGSRYIIEKLLDEHKLDIESKGQFGRTPLMSTVSKGQIHVFRFLHERGADVKCKDDNNDTILHLACHSGNVDMVKFVLSLHIIDIDCRGNLGRTPLMYAVAEGDQLVFKLLMFRGANMDAVDNFNNNILHLACSGGFVDIVRYILSLHLYDVECPGRFGRSPLMFAAENGHIKAVRFLKNKAKITTTDDDGLTALHIACQAGQLEMVKYLVTLKGLKGAEEMKTKAGDTPLNLAVKGGHLDIVSFLKSMK